LTSSLFTYSLSAPIPGKHQKDKWYQHDSRSYQHRLDNSKID
jgi:hypothetical protein